MNLGTLSGAAAGSGLFLLYLWRNSRTINLYKRAAPYLRLPQAPTNSLSESDQVGALDQFSRLFSPWYQDLLGHLDRIANRNVRLQERLQRAAFNGSPTDFRAAQVLWAVIGFVSGSAVSVPLLISGRISPLLAALLTGMFLITGGLGRDWLLSQAITRRETALATQLPTLIELLALAVGAGEAPLAALERVAGRTRGELSLEMRRTVADIHAGTSIESALKNLALRNKVASLVRFADAISIAVERGTPLAQVLQDQARDARENARRELVEMSGRKEIAMLIPVIFFILPITVLFAVYPSMSVLQGGL